MVHLASTRTAWPILSSRSRIHTIFLDHMSTVHHVSLPEPMPHPDAGRYGIFRNAVAGHRRYNAVLSETLLRWSVTSHNQSSFESGPAQHNFKDFIQFFPARTSVIRKSGGLFLGSA